jgi:nucleoside-diphosphate-sugar epimerase
LDPFEIWGDGTQTRDFIHITDVISAALAAVDQDYPSPLNLCTGIGTSFNQLADLVCKSAGYQPVIHHRPDKPVGVHYRVGDPTEMLKVYTPKTSLEDGVAEVLS